MKPDITKLEGERTLIVSPNVMVYGRLTVLPSGRWRVSESASVETGGEPLYVSFDATDIIGVTWDHVSHSLTVCLAS